MRVEPESRRDQRGLDIPQRWPIQIGQLVIAYGHRHFPQWILVVLGEELDYSDQVAMVIGMDLSYYLV